MKRPLIILFSSLAATLLLCTVIYHFYTAGITKFEVHKRERLKEIFEKSTRYDVLFIGSSRTHTTINPAVTDSILHVSCYNAGVEGGFINDFLMTYKGYLIHHPPPGLLFLSLDLWSLESQSGIFDYIQYFPFIDNPEVASYFRSNGYNTSAYSAFPFLTLIHLDDYTRTNAIKGFLGKTEIPAGEFQFAGYMSNSDKTIANWVNTPPTDSLKTLQLKNLSSITALIEICQKTGTKLVISYAPEYQRKLQMRYTNADRFFNAVDSVCIKHNIPFYRDDTLEMSADPMNFANPGHVNTAGAYLYSKIAAHQLTKSFPDLFPDIHNAN
ncbi:MAG TPA: hypothetical protein VFW78_06020 [Bacteroidia bacterium]|nr:hypothetical protein [Bacteroidia bacterium]